MSLIPTTSDPKRARTPLEPASPGAPQILKELVFQRTIAIEHKRTERFKESFLLILFQASQHLGLAKTKNVLDGVASALLSSIRDTDVIGWYKDAKILGVVCTCLAINNEARDSILSAILNRVKATLQGALMPYQFNQIIISFDLFPEEWNRVDSGGHSNRVLYPDIRTC